MTLHRGYKVAILTTEYPLGGLIATTHQDARLSDPVVERLVELHKKLEDAAKDGMVRGWHPLRFDRKGQIVAGKTMDGEYRTNDFEPVGEWKKAAEYLELESEFRSLLFRSDSQMDACRGA